LRVTKTCAVLKPDMAHAIFESSFKAQPYWWEAYRPVPLPQKQIPKNCDVAIIGAGYAGLSAAIELARHGRSCLVLDAAEPGFGASTRNGGQVSGGVSVGKRMLNKPLREDEARPLLHEAADAFSHIERTISENNIDCKWQRTGYYVAAWSKSHFASMNKKLDMLNTEAISEAYLVPPERQREELASDYYHGGMVVERAAHLHPALYFKGLLELAFKANVEIASQTPALNIKENGNNSWSITTLRGVVNARGVIIATNGYTEDVTPDLRRRVVPVGSYIIATEELPTELALSLIPNNRSVADTRRVLTYYRMSPDRRRLIFGGRAKFSLSDPMEAAPLLHRFMVDRFPQLRDVKITHAWTGNVAFTFDELPHTGLHKGLHYALGCNGSGVAMMSWLGHQTARRVLGHANEPSAFELKDFPTHKLYAGKPWFLPIVGSYFRTADWLDRNRH
jgi:glycine/D-amino acid oxidase-like deaminating enzyme